MRNNFDNIFFICPGSDYGNTMWYDVGDMDCAVVFDSPIRTSNALIKFAHHAHFSFRINNIFELPLQTLWRRLYPLNNVKLDKEKKYCVIYTDISACRTDTKYLKRLAEQSNVKLVLMLVNIMKKKNKIINRRIYYFDEIYTFDSMDAEKYNFLYHPYNYSKQDIEDNATVTSDALFVGGAYNRLEMLHKVYLEIVNAGGVADFYITGVKKKDMKYNGIHYNERLNYSEVLKHIARTRCIVEVVSEEQRGCTLRFMEAVCYGKKLITNNVSAMESKFYCEDMIRVTKDLENVDIDFLRRDTKTQYGYTDEFSPKHLIEKVLGNPI